MGIQHPDITRLELFGVPEGTGCKNCGSSFGELIFVYRNGRFCSKNCVIEYLVSAGTLTLEWNDD